MGRKSVWLTCSTNVQLSLLALKISARVEGMLKAPWAHLHDPFHLANFGNRSDTFALQEFVWYIFSSRGLFSVAKHHRVSVYTFCVSCPYGLAAVSQLRASSYQKFRSSARQGRYRRGRV